MIELSVIVFENTKLRDEPVIPKKNKLFIFGIPSLKERRNNKGRGSANKDHVNRRVFTFLRISLFKITEKALITADNIAYQNHIILFIPN